MLYFLKFDTVHKKILTHIILVSCHIQYKHSEMGFFKKVREGHRSLHDANRFSIQQTRSIVQYSDDTSYCGVIPTRDRI